MTNLNPIKDLKSQSGLTQLSEAKGNTFSVQKKKMSKCDNRLILFKNKTLSLKCVHRTINFALSKF